MSDKVHSNGNGNGDGGQPIDSDVLSSLLINLRRARSRQWDASVTTGIDDLLARAEHAGTLTQSKRTALAVEIQGFCYRNDMLGVLARSDVPLVYNFRRDLHDNL